MTHKLKGVEMSEETQEVPKWLKELEDKREKRLKARLGHEAGAGSPCLTCEDKCPGLDLHFWRKICKNCKCGKENHDVNDDDIYGWAQFQLLGSKPVKSKKIVLPGRKEAVELEWTPKGQNEAVESYLKELPLNLLPIKGSAAAQERKQLLQKQVPLHDIDPSLCHALSENEVIKMNDYIMHVKENSVGLGQIMRLEELLKARSAQFLLTRTPLQLAQFENIPMQGAERLTPYNEERFASNPSDPRTIFYDTYGRDRKCSEPRYGHNGNLDETRTLQPQIPKQSITVRDEQQNPSKINSVIKDIHSLTLKQAASGAGANENIKNSASYPRGALTSVEEFQNPSECGIRNVYLDMNVNYDSELGEQLDNVKNLKRDLKLPHYAPGHFNTITDQQTPTKTISNIKDLAYSTHEPKKHNLALNSQQPNEIHPREENLNPTLVNVGLINDLEYPVVKGASNKSQNYAQPSLPRKNVQFDLNPEIIPSCHKCLKVFEMDSYVIGIDRTDSLWHSDCFKCAGCNQNLADLMYFYDKESDEIYCGRDYAKIRGIPRCQACDELIFVKEYCLAENSTFHVKHFCCFGCDVTLAGRNYVMEDLQPLCLPCFENIKAEKCNSCLRVIKPDEQGANLNGTHFHTDDECFACKMCKKPLLGAKLLFKNNYLYCSSHCFAADE